MGIIKNAGNSMKLFYEGMVETFFRGWASNVSRNKLNIMAGPVFDDDLDGRFDKKGNLTHMFVIVTEDGERTEDIKTMSFVIPNWPFEPCDFDVLSEDYLRSTLEMHVATINDIEMLTGLKFKFNREDQNEESEATLKLKLKLPQWWTDFWEYEMN